MGNNQIEVYTDTEKAVEMEWDTNCVRRPTKFGGIGTDRIQAVQRGKSDTGMYLISSDHKIHKEMLPNPVKT